jgi:hypothetical protein
LCLGHKLLRGGLLILIAPSPMLLSSCIHRRESRPTSLLSA